MRHRIRANEFLKIKSESRHSGSAAYSKGGSMKFYVGFDDTDMPCSEIGTGNLVRRLAERLPPGTRLWGVVRHQLLTDDRIPATSHKSSACAIVEAAGASAFEQLRDAAIRHVEEMSLAEARLGGSLRFVPMSRLGNSIHWSRRWAAAQCLTAAAGIRFADHPNTIELSR